MRHTLVSLLISSILALALAACQSRPSRAGLPAECEAYVARYRACLTTASDDGGKAASAADARLRQRLTTQLVAADDAERERIRRGCVANLPGLSAACR